MSTTPVPCGHDDLLLPPSDLEKNPRETMRQLPGWLQPLLTAVTGRPLKDEQPLVRWTPRTRAAGVMLVFVLSIAASAALLHGPAWGWTFLPLTMLLTAGAARAFQIGVVHHGSHTNLTGSKRFDRALGEFVSALVPITPFRDYAEAHPVHHGHTAEKSDPDLQFLIDFGFRPGMSVERLRAHLWASLFGWQFHDTYLRKRVKDNFVTARRSRAILASGLLVGLPLAALAIWLALGGGLWTPTAILLAYLIPVAPLFQIAGLLQTLTEHQWVWLCSSVKTKKVVMGELTFGRYAGEPLPDLAWANWKPLACWAARMAFLHWPTRILVLQLDLPNHAFHHRHPKGDWANAAFAQRDDEMAGDSAWGPYRETWGLRNAIGHNFRLLASLPVDAEVGEPLTRSQRLDRMGGM